MAPGKILALHDRKLIKTSSAYCLFSVRSANTKSILKAGMAIQRFWLHLTGTGLVSQPMNAPVIHCQRHMLNSTRLYTEAQWNIAEQTRCNLQDLQKAEDLFPVFFMRIGRPSASSPRSGRLPLSCVTLVNEDFDKENRFPYRSLP